MVGKIMNPKQKQSAVDPGYTNLASYAWYADNSGSTTHPVGQKFPNSWGLYDMHGNVFEWCQDWAGAYPGGIALDPQGPATGPNGVTRGGCWGSSFPPKPPGSFCRSAFRLNISEPDTNRGNWWGFRVVLTANGP
jgi:formylglycine-generating enzyme required for sulfatase activity